MDFNQQSPLSSITNHINAAGIDVSSLGTVTLPNNPIFNTLIVNRNSETQYTEQFNPQENVGIGTNPFNPNPLKEWQGKNLHTLG